MLEQLFHELNREHFRGELPLPKLGWNSRLSSTAGRFCTGSRNPLFPRPPLIEVATYLRGVPEGTMHVRDTVLHEMIHYYLWFLRRPHGHTLEFKQIMNRVGAKRYNTVPKDRDWKHWYECPQCLRGFHTRRKLGISACLQCCERHSGGHFHARFQLVRKDPRNTAPRTVTILRSTSAAEEKSVRGQAVDVPPVELALAEPPRMPPSEIIRRLEELKAMLRSKTDPR